MNASMILVSIHVRILLVATNVPVMMDILLTLIFPAALVSYVPCTEC